MYRTLIILLLFAHPLCAMEQGRRIKGILENLLSSHYIKRADATKEVKQSLPEHTPIEKEPATPIVIPSSPQQTAKVAVWQVGLWGAATVLTTLLLQRATNMVWFKHSSLLGIAADVAIAAGCGYAWSILSYAHMPKSLRTQMQLQSKLLLTYGAGIGGMATAMAFGNIICAPKGYTNPRFWGASVIAAPLMIGAKWHWNNKK